MFGPVIVYLQTFVVGGVGGVLVAIAIPLAFFAATRAGSVLTGFAGMCCLSVSLGPWGAGWIASRLIPDAAVHWRWPIWIVGSVAGPLLCVLVAVKSKPLWGPLFQQDSDDEPMSTPSA